MAQLRPFRVAKLLGAAADVVPPSCLARETALDCKVETGLGHRISLCFPNYQFLTPEGSMAAIRTISRTYYALQPLWVWFRALLLPVNLGVRALAEDKDGRVLLVRHSYVAGWHFPGGGVGRGEHPADAALRELREETGLTKSGPPEFVGLFARRIWWTVMIVVLYRFRDVEIAFEPNFEVREAMFTRPEELPPDAVRGVHRRIAEMYRGEPVSKEW
jgi:8-oxo-dGTP pyrophosphatase MutT (NUDIX family)